MTKGRGTFTTPCVLHTLQVCSRFAIVRLIDLSVIHSFMNKSVTKYIIPCRAFHVENDGDIYFFI